MNAKTQAQYQNIDGNDLAQFKDTASPRAAGASSYRTTKSVTTFALSRL
jgi:hypothetical protein